MIKWMRVLPLPHNSYTAHWECLAAALPTTGAPVWQHRLHAHRPFQPGALPSRPGPRPTLPCSRLPRCRRALLHAVPGGDPRGS